MSCGLCGSEAPRFWIEPKTKLDFYRCPECDLTFKDPARAVAPREAADRYRRHAEDPNDPGHRQFLSALAEPLKTKLKPGMRGLDYGCGPGRTLQAMLKGAGVECDAYDPLFFPQAELLERTYDFVTCTEVAEHFADPRKEFARLFALARTTLAMMSQSPPADFANWWYHRDPTHVVFYSDKTWNWIAKHNGWSLELFPKGVAIFTKGTSI